MGSGDKCMFAIEHFETVIRWGQTGIPTKKKPIFAVHPAKKSSSLFISG
jgi:hypothetical protein